MLPAQLQRVGALLSTQAGAPPAMNAGSRLSPGSVRALPGIAPTLMDANKDGAVSAAERGEFWALSRFGDVFAAAVDAAADAQRPHSWTP